jgi:hypothetical protein
MLPSLLTDLHVAALPPGSFRDVVQVESARHPHIALSQGYGRCGVIYIDMLLGIERQQSPQLALMQGLMGRKS